MLKELERLLTCKTAHLLQSLNRNQGSERLALALDDELVVPERNPVQHVADARANVHGRNLLSHSNYDSCKGSREQSAETPKEATDPSTPAGRKKMLSVLPRALPSKQVHSSRC